MMDSAIARFQVFVERARHIVESSPQLPTSQFDRFIQQATPIVIGGIHERIPLLLETVGHLEPWLVQHDLLDRARIRLPEDAYTELLAWALASDTHPESALKRQKAFLAACDFELPEMPDEPAEPRTQFGTDDGVPDLVLVYPDCVVIVEAKLESEEHRTPSGSYQTEAYPPAVLRRLGLEKNFPAYTALLSPQRKQPANPHARSVAFVDVAVSIASTLSPEELPEPVRWPMAMFLTHLVSKVSPPLEDGRLAIETLSAWRSTWGLDWPDSAIVGGLQLIAKASDAFLGEAQT